MLLFLTLVYTPEHESKQLLQRKVLGSKNPIFLQMEKQRMPKGTSGNLSGRNDKHLTDKQIRFAKEYVYNDGSKELQNELDKKYEVTFGRHVRELAKIRDKAIDKGNLTAAVSAEVQRGRAAGLYVERKEVRTGTLESLSEVEIKNRIKKLLGDYKPLLEVEDAVVIDAE